MQGAVGDADASIYLRDFERAGLAAKETMIYGLCEGFQASEPRYPSMGRGRCPFRATMSLPEA
eukprot:6965717-Ditylum_brightwellii.AAC.1